MHAPERDERPGPGETYNPGKPTPPRQAASVILLRGLNGDSDDQGELEVLLVKRTPKARFMGGVWVFPGGAVDAHEGDGDDAHRAAALRELREEAGIALADAEQLIKFSRWITPVEVQIRLDTHFFLAPLPAGQEPVIDGEECVDLGWFTPAGALDAFRSDQISLVFPTIKHLEQLREFPSAQALLDYARGRDVQPVQPRVILEGEVARIVLPGEPGY
jgi:8-oxo-dGTP pyrophosphatase MutT (NUDIX family)